MSKPTKPKANPVKQSAIPRGKRTMAAPKVVSEAPIEAPVAPTPIPPTAPTGGENTNELATVDATTKLSLRDLTVQRYQSKGWQIMNTPRGGINDLVAGKTIGGKYRYHFVQFVESEDDIDNALRYKGEAKGAFIQNAYSNQATPVYVIPRKSGSKRKVVLENADTSQKIIP
jgi:hypothetical protein